ncbi:MAG TPA: hypothetical protein DGR97_10750 [Gammaproteobacteria bacterium]|nr:hypothetical protein [Gammaproteobacteria bacterium]|tara:strand:+ start:291 stop:1544 length:1254 start_codon:yes stop_codon:yes gene_type:complete
MSKIGSSETENLKVGIVGGSIAGCAAAVELSRAGFDVTLFERSGNELKDRGAGIGVPPSVVETFISRDLVDHDIPYFRLDKMSRIWRSADEPYHGYVAWDQPAQLGVLNWGGLYNNLRARVPDAIYRPNHNVVALQQTNPQQVEVILANGATHKFDLVVCADGYTSLGRSTLFPDVTVDYAGYVLWRGFIMEREIGKPKPLDDGVRCLGYPGGHGIFYFVPGPDGSIEPGERLVNWGMYITIPETEIADFLTDKQGIKRTGSLSPGSMPTATQRSLKDQARERIPDYYADIVEKSPDTFVYSIYDCQVPAYRIGRICLAGDAGAFARPHSAAGALKGINDSVTLADALKCHSSVGEALAKWDSERTATNNGLVQFGNQLGLALVQQIPDWSKMNPVSMEEWFSGIVTIATEYLPATP